MSLALLFRLNDAALRPPLDYDLFRSKAINALPIARKLVAEAHAGSLLAEPMARKLSAEKRAGSLSAEPLPRKISA